MGTFETTSKGDRSYVAGGGGPGSPGVIVLHPWWGLNDDVVAYADRLAALGFTVVAPDMFDGQVATTIEDAQRLTSAADEETVDRIVLAAIEQLVGRVGEEGKLAALGFSFGAHWAIWSPAERDQVVASVLYYGTTGDRLADSKAPVLGHFAENDPYETGEWVAEFEQILRSAGREVEIRRYPGTGHWFAEPSRDAYQAEAANLAFKRTVAFLKDHLA